ncbi:aldo/keto reductase [Lagierella sp.]|uniref:aldo/keto reductase n=1 Tax=Lagierella sp. TaxID=2849657 RepID=UPI0026118C37|nr:aldo/keto reductase [Lagierella sp.]
MKNLILKTGIKIPKLGITTYKIGEDPSLLFKEVDALRYALEGGIKLIDTAEMYTKGKAELIVGKAIENFNRKELFLVSKICPFNCKKEKIYYSIENTLKRLKTDYLDLYLIGWAGPISFQEAVNCLEELRNKRLIKHWGVSNFDLFNMKKLHHTLDGDHCVVNQVLYHLGSRGTEFELQGFLKEKGIRMMAYCPMAMGGMLNTDLINNIRLNQIACKYNISIQGLLLAFVLSRDNIIPIPKSTDKKHIDEIIRIGRMILDRKDLRILDNIFPPPSSRQFLDIV